MKVAIAQFGPTADFDANYAEIRTLTARAVAEGARLVVFPEEAMVLAEALREPIAGAVAVQWPRFEQLLTALAVEHDVAIIAGGYEPSSSERPYNTLLAVDAGGVVAARYHKLHLYDAFSYQESAYVTPGADLPPVVQLAGLKVGLINCYDIRFPELARHLIDSGAELLTVSAAWVDGLRKAEHWSTLLSARAIENTVWLAAAGSISAGCIGDSVILDPLGVERAALGDELSAVAVIDVTAERTEFVRAKLPALANRRLDLAITVRN
ncbi:MAG: carbon-nitrogen hydrolase family protein [Naasia sp.]|uniref:carbon-nitrogen hydrolase family protein n=1 Tax=Naasia sp. TaxID=2546198 RepID=UPI00263189FE|nr:carbon-nitrogen hydrolase family protein [Naasia sp.]MCU1569713.1 carbon-nitrogen hydrolase family protein [Naasia sp.]